jgi:hypothetical protein
MMTMENSSEAVETNLECEVTVRFQTPVSFLGSRPRQGGVNLSNSESDFVE